MGKGDRRGKGDDARAKWAAIVPVVRKQTNGRARRPVEKRDKSIQNLKARCRQMGKLDDNADEMRAAMIGEDPGRALALTCDPDTAARLWQWFVDMSAAEARYHRSIGKSLHAKTARLEVLADRFETRADDRPDLRTQDERDRDAVTGWMRWQGYLGRLSAADQSAIFMVYRHGAVAVVSGVVTRAGKRFVAAMLALDRVM